MKRFKNYLLILLAVAVTLASMPVYMVNAETTEDGFFYSLSEDETEITITGYTGTASEITVPSKINNIPVTAIGSLAFANNTDITSVKLPDTVTSIGDCAFQLCTKLSEITLGSGLKIIEPWAFRETAFSEISFPEGLEMIDAYAFYDSAVESVQLPASLKYLGSGVFGACPVMSVSVSSDNADYYSKNNCVLTKSDNTLVMATLDFEIPAECTALADYAFWGLAITSLHIPENVKSFGSNTFMDCDELTTITVSEDNTVYYSEGNCIMDKSSKALLFGCAASTIPSDCTEIADWAFKGNLNLKKISIPASVKKIGYVAFCDCLNLDEVVFESGVETIGDRAFYCCSKLTNVNLPESVTSIGEHAFAQTALTEVTIPNSVKSIGVYAFSEAPIAKVTLGTGLEEICDGAFYSCEITSVEIPEKVTTIGIDVFDYAELASLTVNENSETFYSSGNCVLTKENNVLVLAGADFIIPDTCLAIGEGVFASRTLEEIVIPEGVGSIGAYAFYNCGEFLELILPSGVKSVAENAFANCSFSYITVPTSLETVAANAFQCGYIEHVLYKGTEAEWNEIGIDDSNSKFKNAARHYEAGSVIYDTVEAECETAGYDTAKCPHCDFEKRSNETESSGHYFIDGECTGCEKTESDIGTNGSYGENLDITWTVEKTGADRIALTFDENFSLQENADFLFINEQNGALLGCYTGTALAGATVELYGSSVTLRLQTDSTPTDDYGFKITKIEAFFGPFATEEPTAEPTEIPTEEPTAEPPATELPEIVEGYYTKPGTYEVISEDLVAKTSLDEGVSLTYRGYNGSIEVLEVIEQDGKYWGKIAFPFPVPIPEMPDLEYVYVELDSSAVVLEKAETEAALGDANTDGKINMADVVAVRRYLVNAEKYPLASLENADVNGDGKVNMADVVAVRRYLVNAEKYPIG